MAVNPLAKGGFGAANSHIELNMQQLIVIEAGRTERHYWLDLWRYRELFLVLARRDLSVRYKQTIIGVLWALIRPFLTMLILTIVLGQSLNCLPKEALLMR